MFTVIEFSLAAIAIAAAYAVPNLGSGWFGRAEQFLRRVAQKRGLSVLLVGLLALVARAGLLPVLPVPQPAVGDEFGYLLDADTFAHGRLTNPTHPMWIHFETFYVIQKPTYVSMFYPSQGLFLGLGQAIGGHPFVGVWLSIGLMCAAICWMLQGWLPPEWALLGGLLAVIRLGTFSYWANSYWGGAAAAIGGALVLGALPRIKENQRLPDALLMGLGLAILANSRPYESLFFGLPIGVALLAWMLGRNSPPWKLSIKRIILPLGLVLIVTIGAMGYYFWRTTGSPFLTPYLVHMQTYTGVPYFAWQALRPEPEYHHSVMRNLYMGWHLQQYKAAHSLVSVLSINRIVHLWLFYLGPILTLPIVALATLTPVRSYFRSMESKTHFLVLVFCVTLLGVLLPVYFNPHYAAPLTCVFYALVLLAMRQVREWRWQGEPTGRFLTRAVPSICLGLLLLRVAAPLVHIDVPVTWSHTWCSQQFQIPERAQMMSQLQGEPGRTLVIVRYGADHDPLREWVYNEADIDAAKVVWARDMGPSKNQELVDYFRERNIWLVEPDKDPPKLTPYPTVDLSDGHN